MQQILNVAKIEDSDCNSLTVEIGFGVTNNEIKEKPKRKRKQDNKIKKCQERKRKLERDFEVNTEKLNSIRKKNVNKIVKFCNFLYLLKIM